MYRTLIKIYIIITIFTFRKRVKRSNVLFFTLKFHKNNFNDVINILQILYYLNAKQILIINN